MQTEQTINIDLKPMNEQAPHSAGPMGRLARITNGVAKKFIGDSLRVSKRPGSTSLPATTYAAGALTTSPTNPKLLASWKDQLVIIGGTTPYAFSDALQRWEQPSYPFATTPSIATQTLTRRSLYNGNAKTYSPDVASVGNVQCFTLVDSTLGTLVTMVDSDGVQIRAPFAATGTARAKVVSDGAVFWVFSQVTAATDIFVQVFDTNGAQLATTTLAFGASRTIWDVGYQSTNAQAWAAIDTGGLTSFVTMTYAASVITVVINALPAIDSSGGLFRIENTQGGTGTYIGAVNAGNDVTGYQISAAGAITHTYTVVAGVAGYIGNGTGFVVNGSFDIRIAFSVLADNTAVTPSLSALDNKTFVYNVTFAGVSGLRKTQLSLALVSRAYVDADGTWRFVAYYQSSGSSQTATIGGVTITDVSPLGAQPSFFVMEFSSTVPAVVGQFDLGAAYAFYATSRNSIVFQPWHLSSVSIDSDDIQHIPLGYLGTQQLFGATNGGQLLPGFAALTGAYDYQISQRVGRALPTSDFLLIPGMEAVMFDGTQFTEEGLHLAPEIVTEVVAAGGSLTVGELYTWVFVYEWKDAAGNVYQSPPSAPFSFTLSGGNTQVTFTISNLRTTLKTGVSIVGYRTFSPTLTGTTAGVILRRIGSVTGSPTSNTATFLDQMSDTDASLGQECYTQPLDESAPVALDFFPLPAFSKAAAFDGRQFVIGYDGAIWFTFQKTEGLGIATNPFFRILLPTPAKPIDIAPMDSRMVISCDDGTVWTFPGGNLPNATATTGAIPQPEQTRSTTGTTSASLPTPYGVFYGAASGIWLMDPSLNSKFIGGPVVDEANATTQVTDIAVDTNQRVYFTLGTDGELGTLDTVLVFDLVSNCWYVWDMPEALAASTVWRGRFVFADGAGVVHAMDPDDSTDYTDDGDAILSTYELASIDFAGVNGYESCWQVQFYGSWEGPHTLSVQLKFDQSDTVTETFTQVVDVDPGIYRFEMMPTQIDCQAMGIIFSDSFPDAPGNSFALEAIGVLVGIEKGLGRISPTTRRIAP